LRGRCFLQPIEGFRNCQQRLRTEIRTGGVSEEDKDVAAVEVGITECIAVLIDQFERTADGWLPHHADSTVGAPLQPPGERKADDKDKSADGEDDGRAPDQVWLHQLFPPPLVPCSPADWLVPPSALRPCGARDLATVIKRTG